MKSNPSEFFAVMKKICQACTGLRLKRGDFVYTNGQEPQAIFLVESGLVGLVAVSSKGSEHLLRLFKPGEFFGHRSFFAKEPYHASAVCLEPSELRLVDETKVSEALRQKPELLEEVVVILARELGQAELQRVTLVEQDVLSRTAAAVVYLREITPDHTWTRQEIASFCASTTPSVIRALGELAERGLIRQEGRKIEILDRQALLELVH